MFTGSAIKPSEESPSILPIPAEMDSLVSLLSEGRRLDRRRTNNQLRNTELYPLLEECEQRRQGRNQNTLDTTFHTSSYLLNEALTMATVDKAYCTTNQAKDQYKACTAGGTFNIRLMDSFKHNLYTSIDLSNISNSRENMENAENPIKLCINIVNTCSNLESLCLHNCHLDDTCVKFIASIITSKANKLNLLNLSNNKITDIGAQLLLDAMKSHHCKVKEFDLSQNQLSLSGIACFAEGLSDFLHVKVLRLADSEHLIPVSVYKHFSTAIERNVTIHTLTLGTEVMDGTVNDFTENIVMEKKQKVDELLRCFWQEPLYAAETDHIRNLLQQNNAGINELICKGRIDVDAIRLLFDSVKPEKELDACFRLLRLKPDILLAAA